MNIARIPLGIILCISLAATQLASCGTKDDGPQGNPVAINCGFEESPGNSVGVGKYCEETSDCPQVSEGTALQCSTVLVENSLPLMCSRLCVIGEEDTGCGPDAVCKNIIELDIDLDVCVPLSCQPLFSEPLQ